MKTILILVMGASVLWSCNQRTQTDSATSRDAAEAHAGHDHDHDHHYNESDAPLELNDGNKWKVNEEMKPFLNKSEEILASYKEGNQQDHQALGKQLQEQNTLLIQNCTMTGKSHDELHKWLHPHMALLAELSTTDDKDEAQRLIKEIDESFATYHAHFE